MYRRLSKKTFTSIVSSCRGLSELFDLFERQALDVCELSRGQLCLLCLRRVRSFASVPAERGDSRVADWRSFASRRHVAHLYVSEGACASCDLPGPYRPSRTHGLTWDSLANGAKLSDRIVRED